MSRSLAYQHGNALNAICPYFTMFPLEYPLRVLGPHRNGHPIVMDPFCGRGTTLFAARQLGLVARGIDSSPVAIAIAKAKLCNVDIPATLALARSFIETSLVESENVPNSEFFQCAFNPETLRQVCSIRTGLLQLRRDNGASILLRAAMLGCLHGPTNKRPGNYSYFSNQMPRTFAAKPDYSVRFWRSRRIRPPGVEVLAVLQRKLSRIAALPPVAGVSHADARLGDSRLARSLPSSKRDFSVVVTSPPYYGMKTYVEDQWLRNWFLGGPPHVEYATSTQLEHGSKVAFAESLGAVWSNMARSHAEKLHMYIRFGLIPSSKADPRTLMLDSLEASGVRWRRISTREAKTASSGKRQADHMSAESTAAVEYDFHVSRE